MAVLAQIREQLERMESKMVLEAKKWKPSFAPLHPDQQLAAENLIHYLTLRREDVRELQDMLHIYGLSSLASSESHILSQVQAILGRLGKEYGPDERALCNYEFSRLEMEKKSYQLFGKTPDAQIPAIMVTFDTTFAENYALVKNLLLNGMNVARINCAHDEEETWSRMIQNLRRACRHTGISCKIYMDIAGPKIRTRLIGKGKENGKVEIKEGELIWLADEIKANQKQEVVISPNEPGIVGMLKKGERVFIDDGIIKCVVEEVHKSRAAIRVVRISSKKNQIKSGKGINFPDTELLISPLTDFDRSCLPFICEHADMVGFSFVSFPSDLEMLQRSLDQFSGTPPAIILKIETTESVKNLPALLMQGMHRKDFGLMIARGDLAVEIGFERLGEIQEEILWICEASHVPVIWATQVLESLNKSGVAARSEITDAAHAASAECVMINKGAHTIEVIETLKDIMHRMGGHHIKKRFTFRPLSIAIRFLKDSSIHPPENNDPAID